MIGLQFQLGSDIVVCLDDCTDAEAPEAEQERSVERTVRWARRCREEFDRQVAQRATTIRRASSPSCRAAASETLRRQCATALAEIGFDGYGFGGWPLDADGALLADPLRWVAESLPADAPKHALGIGRPDHVVGAFAPGLLDLRLRAADARRATRPPLRLPPGLVRASAVTRRRLLSGGADPRCRAPVDHAPIEDGCDCPVCARHSTAYLHHLFKVGDLSAERLATLHNLRFYVRLFEQLRSG